RDDGDLVPGKVAVEVNRLDASARDAAPHRDAVDHVGEVEVVDVAGLARDLLASLLTEDRLPDQRRSHRRDFILRSARRSRLILFLDVRLVARESTSPPALCRWTCVASPGAEVRLVVARAEPA